MGVKMIDDKLKKSLINVFKSYKEIEKVILFGSRARGDNKKSSDVDLCLVGQNINHLVVANATMDILEINTPLSFDILSFNELSKKELIDNILNEGIIIYNEQEIR